MAGHTRVLQRDGKPTAIEFTRCSLVVTQGPDAGKKAPLETSSVRIGSSPGCNLVLTDPTVSREHCEIEVGENGFLLRDLASTNGVFVGNVQIKEGWLAPLSVFRAGATEIRLEPGDDTVEIRLSDAESFGDVLGRSAKMREVFFLLERMAPKDVTILLGGETGTGKDLLARAIHEKSTRRGAPFLTVDCGSLPENLIESELFGHARGAFTGASGERAGVFEEARGGTVFLDEIGELPLSQQTKLLRVLENREIKRLGESNPRAVDVRILAATNKSLPDEVEAGTFRKDLYYRLSVVEVRIPSLRDRAEDIPLLAAHFAGMFAAREKRPTPRLAPGALASLQAHPWQGNVRELRNVMEKALALSEGGELDATGIALGSMRNRPDPSRPGDGNLADGSLPYDEAHDRFEREYLLDLLRKNEMNITKAGRAAGIHRQTIHRMLRKHGIDLAEYR